MDINTKKICFIVFVLFFSTCLLFSQKREVKFFTEGNRQMTVLKLKILIDLGGSNNIYKPICKVTITVWKDNDKDCRLEPAEQEIIKEFSINSNEFKECPTMTKLYEVYCPIDTINECLSPDKYLADVFFYTLGKSVVEYSTNRSFFEKCNCQFNNNIVKILLTIVNPFSWTDIISRNLKGRNTRRHGIFRLDIQTGNIEKLAYNAELTFYMPRPSPNNQLLAYAIRDKSGGTAIEVLDIRKGTVVRFGEGRNDTSPHWVATNDTLVFVRDRKIYFGNVLKGSFSPLTAIKIADQVLYACKLKGKYEIIYSVNNENETTEFRQFTLDDNLTLLEDVTLVPDQRWQLLDRCSITGDSILIDHVDNINGHNKLYFCIPKLEQKGLSSEYPVMQSDTLNYFDPSWGPSSKHIIFVSNKL